MELLICRWFTHVEETPDTAHPDLPPLRKVAASVVVKNPYAGQKVLDLSPMIQASAALGPLLADLAIAAMNPLEIVSYGKGGIVGLAGDQEHANALVTSTFADPLRARLGGGAAWMCQAAAATTLVEAVVKAVDVPVTVKMRLGWDDESLTAPSLARSFEQIGVAAVIIHGRTRDQGFKGTVNRDGIRAVVEAVDKMPVVANGDLRTILDVASMFEETGCAAVSIGRGALSNPFLFRQLTHWAEQGRPGPDPTFEDRVDVMVDHFRGLLARRGERIACLQFRKLVKWYSYAIRPPKELYNRLINLSSGALFEEVVVEIRQTGPTSPLPGHLEPRVPVPTGPIDKW